MSKALLMGLMMRQDVTYHMIAHSDKQVEEQSAALFHLGLHRATLLEVVATADDEGQILGSKFRVSVRSVVVCIASGREDG